MQLPSSLDVRRAPPFGALRPVRRYQLDVGAVRPVIHIAHRIVGPLGVSRRMLLDHEFVFILRGRGEVVFDDVREAFGARSLVLLRPFEPHAFEAASEVEHIAVHFDFAPDVPRGKSIPKRKPYAVDLAGGEPIARVQRLAPRSATETALVDLVRTWQIGGASGRLRAAAQLMTAIAHVTGPAPTGAVQRHQARLEKAITLIDAAYDQPLEAHDLAIEADLSPAHFNRLFRQWTGRSPMKYLRHRRIEVARELLANEGLTVKEIAVRVGFDDPYHFSRAFREVEGMSPSAYRDALLG